MGVSNANGGTPGSSPAGDAEGRRGPEPPAGMGVSGPLWYVSCAALFAAALALRGWVARDLEHPGHGDPSFYYEVARSFAHTGRLEIDYIWHYLSPPESRTHFAGDYWMVGSSVLMALPLVFGAGLPGAVGVAMAFGLATGALTLAIARALGASRPAAFCAAAFVLFEPNLFNYSTSPNAPIFYTTFVTAALLFLVRAARRGQSVRGYALAGLSAGLAHATRQDGLFILPALWLAALLRPRAQEGADGAPWRAMAAATLGYVVAMGPLFVVNLIELGTPLPSSLSRTMFARGYEDIYAFAKSLDWASYQAWGWDNIRASKRAALEGNLTAVRDLLGVWLGGLVVIGFVRALATERDQRGVLLATLALVAVQLFFYSFIGTAVASEGGFFKAALAPVPFLVAVTLATLERGARRPGKAWLGLVPLALFVGLAYPKADGCVELARRKVRFSNAIGASVKSLEEALEQAPLPDGELPVVMTRDPWELAASSPYGALQVPNDDLDTILDVARRYGATHIVLPVPRSAVTLELALEDPRFEEGARIAGTRARVFRLRLD